ncbi:MAG: TIGR01777 family oxidoreductase [Parachlamydiaceae bacterium]|nr:TIGR01777 family oxidoreductase [Parachlamydiaceae bacterium]
MMKIAITGANGFIGSALSQSLKNHEVIPLKHFKNTFYFQNVPLEQIEGLDIVIHLAGESIMGYWNEKKKKKIRESRVLGTQSLCNSLAALKNPPGLLICASAVGYYGNRKDEILNEKSSKGKGFLSDVCAEWEEATRPAVEAGIRTINLRFGMVLGQHGGALKQMTLPFKLGLGGKMGSGEQFVSWIALEDLIRIFQFLINNNYLSGPVNAVSSFPVTNQELTKTLGRIMNRPTFLSMPTFLVKLIFGEMGQELLLSSQKVIPEKLMKAGFSFEYPTLELALTETLLHSSN